ncbi:MAG TPA: metallophosphoesterase [Candidatus Korarchaeota archaeon]|nr:metallophosphoesterase [Candidatus Korarchaeota archaeon]
MRKECFFLLFFLFLSPLTLAGINKKVRPVNGVLLPRIGFPSFIEPNSSFEVILVGEIKEVRPSIENDLRFYELIVEKISYNSSENLTYLTLTAGDVNPGLYSLIIESEKVIFREPNCVSVRESWELPLTVFWLSDTHYDNRKGQFHLAARFRRHIWTINFFSPDLAIITGDVCNNPPEGLFIGAYHELIDLQHPIVLIPGNHDHSLKGDFFTKYLAPSNASLDVGPVHIICLDTGPGSLSGNITKDQKEWLVKDLESASEKPIKMLLIHHPLFTIWNATEVTVEEIVNILVRYNVTMVLSGHMHESYVFEDPILMITNPNSYGKGVGRALPGFRVFELTSSGEIKWLKSLYEPIYLEEFKILVFQTKDGEAKGFSAYLYNGLPRRVSGKFMIKLAAEPLEAEGGRIIQINRTRDGKFLVTLKVDLEPQQEKLVKVWAEEDVDPPYYVNLSKNIAYGANINVIWVNITARDEILGVKNVTLKYSTDNITWNDVQLIRLNEILFTGRFQVQKNVPVVYYIIEAVDAEENIEIREGKIVFLPEITERKEAKPTPIPWKLIVMAALISVVLILTVVRMKER